MMAKRVGKLLSIALAVFFAMMAAGCQFILPKEEEPLAPPLMKHKDIVYATVDVVRGDMQQTLQGVGRVESVKMIDLSYPQSGGRLKSIGVKVGDKIKKGDIVAQLDTTDLDYRLQVEQIRLKQMENTFASLKKAMKHARDKTPVTNASMDVDIQKLTVQQLMQQKTDSVLRAPIDGSVTYLASVNTGDVVDAYSTLVRIADESVKMMTYLKESNVTQFQIGMKVKVTMRIGNTAAEGEVVSTPDDMVRKDFSKPDSTVYIKLPENFLEKAAIGEEATLIVIIADRQNVLMLPRNCVQTYMQRRYVQMLVNGVKVEKDVQIGLETTTECEIISGLEEGDKVIAG